MVVKESPVDERRRMRMRERARYIRPSVIGSYVPREKIGPFRWLSDAQINAKPSHYSMTDAALEMSERRTAEIEAGNDGAISSSWRASNEPDEN